MNLQAANDLSMDPIETRVLRCALPVAFVAGKAAPAFLGWLLAMEGN